MRERPILFSGEMVRAILDGRKTMTRRTLSDKLIFNVNPDRYRFLGFNDDGEALFEDLQPEIIQWISPVKCPYGKVGDRLWVRETWADINDGEFILYRATEEEMFDKGGEILGTKFKWSSPRFMPRRRSRINLEITGVRVERLNEISEEDAMAEGLEPADGTYTADFALHGYVKAFRYLWHKINGKKHPWASNPWVWVIEFKKLEAK